MRIYVDKLQRTFASKRPKSRKMFGPQAKWFSTRDYQTIFKVILSRAKLEVHLVMKWALYFSTLIAEVFSSFEMPETYFLRLDTRRTTKIVHTPRIVTVITVGEWASLFFFFFFSHVLVDPSSSLAACKTFNCSQRRILL